MKRRSGFPWRLVLEIIVSLIALGIMAVQVSRQPLKMGLKLVFQVRIDQDAVFELEVDEQRIKARAAAGERFRDLEFKLPAREIRKIRLHFDPRIDSVGLGKVTIKTLFKSYSWPPDAFEKIFNYRNHIDRSRESDGVYRILPGRGDPFLGFSRTLPGIINRLGGRKWFFYLVGGFLVLLLFGVMHGLDPRNLRVFFRLPVLGNFVLVFLLAIFFPMINSVLHVVSPLSIQERRSLAPKPVFRFDSLKEFTGDYRRYHDDHFVWRNHCIRVNSLIGYCLFRVSATPLVTLGKQDWLFMAEEDPKRDETDYFRSVDLFGSTELDNWTRILEQRRMWLAAMGIKYLFVVAPNKSTIYPEFMPDRFIKMHAVSRLDQLLEHLRLHSEVKILDLRPVLMKAKKDHPVYYKTDSHWNDFGGYWAYREIIRAITAYYPSEKPIPLSDFDIIRIDRAGGDLAQALTLEKNLLRERNIKMEPRIPFKARTVSRVNLSPYVSKSESQCPSGRLPAALMVHDSFVHELRPFLAQHFSRMVWVWDWGLNIYPKLIRKEKPWLVIEEMAERYLMDKTLSNPAEIFPREE